MSRRASRFPAWLVLLVCAALMIVPLPPGFGPFRPAWATLALIYWVMMWPRLFGLGSAFLLGIVVDVLQGNLLGQHALSMTLVAYLTMRFHLQIRIFPLWQLTASVCALLAVEAFILFWIDGVAGNPGIGLARWTQVLTGAIVWPAMMMILDRFREHVEYNDSIFA